MYNNDLGSFLGGIHLEDLKEGFVDAGIRTVDDIARICDEEDPAQLQELMNNMDLELLDYIKIKKAIKDMKQLNQQMGNVGNASRVGDASRFPSSHMGEEDIKGELARKHCSVDIST